MIVDNSNIHDQVVCLTLLNKCNITLQNRSLLEILKHYEIQDSETLFGNLFNEREESEKITEMVITDQIGLLMNKYEITFQLDQLKCRDLYEECVGVLNFDECKTKILNSPPTDLFEITITITNKDQQFMFCEIFNGSKTIQVQDFKWRKPTESTLYMHMDVSQIDKPVFTVDSKITKDDYGYAHYKFVKIISVLKYFDDQFRRLEYIACAREQNDWWSTHGYICTYS